MEWLVVAAVILVPWTAVVTKTIQNEFTDTNFLNILLLPVVLVGIFGIVSVGVIAFRVYNFNDCVEAADELKKQIHEAQEDLKKRGLKMDG